MRSLPGTSRFTQGSSYRCTDKLAHRQTDTNRQTETDKKKTNYITSERGRKGNSITIMKNGERKTEGTKEMKEGKGERENKGRKKKAYQ